MLRRWHLVFITILLAIVVLNKVHAYYDDDDDDDNDYKDDYYDGHYEGDGCGDDEDLQDVEDLEEIARLLASKGITPNKIATNGISPMAGQGLILPVVPSDTCSTSWFSNDVYKRFNAIFFGNFHAYGVIIGPLAVKGDLTGYRYLANAERGADCSSHGNVGAYSLVVGGSINVDKVVQVNGDALINGGGNMSQVQEYISSCYVTNMEGTGVVDFDALEVEANDHNNIYREHPPTLQIGDDRSLKRLTDSDQNIEYITFNSCNNKSSCAKIWDGQMSAAESILFGQGTSTGIKGDMKPDSTKTFVFNIPVIENTNITITAKYPSLGFNGCKLVYNFYPVKQGTGEYNPTGNFTLVRKNSGFIYGLILAPRGKIIDGSEGYFAGQIFGMSYTSESIKVGNVINMYDKIRGPCKYFDGCNPEVVESCTTEISTKTDFKTATVSPDTITTLTQETTVTKGRDTITQLSTIITTNSDTKTITSLVTETVYHTHDEDCDEEEEEHYKDSYKKKWDHKEHDEEDDCDEDHYY